MRAPDGENVAYMKKEVNYTPFCRNFNELLEHIGHMQNNLSEVPRDLQLYRIFCEKIFYMPLPK